MNVARRPQEERCEAYEDVPVELVVVTEPMVVSEPMMVSGPMMMVSKPVVVLEAVITDGVMTVPMELATAMMAAVEAVTAPPSVGRCRPGEQQGEHEPWDGTKRYSPHSTQHGNSVYRFATIPLLPPAPHPGGSGQFFGLAPASRGVQRYCVADESLEGGVVDFVAFVQVDGTPRLAFKAGVEDLRSFEGSLS